ncbi:MAG: glutathione S-transferase family protein [Pseudomonadota bacterium]
MSEYILVIGNKNYSSWSLRPWVLMKAAGIAFEEKPVLFTGDDHFDEFRAFAPNGMVPCLHDGEDVIWDSLAIAEYLAERHDGIWPEDGRARAWARCAAAEMHSGFGTLRANCPMNVGVRAKLKDPPARLARDIARIAELWAEGQERFGGPWLAGESFTAVDAFYAPVAYRARTFDLDMGASGEAWVNNVLAHPAMQIWEAAALAETEREPSHEADIISVADVISDRRAIG